MGSDIMLGQIIIGSEILAKFCVADTTTDLNNNNVSLGWVVVIPTSKWLWFELGFDN